MPAARLPWFRFWIGATAHAKARQLDDGTFRTWVELLDAAAQQSVRGRFANRQAAAAVLRRPVKHVATLITAGLIDEAGDGRLTMHDWDWWQRWRKEDGNEPESPTDQPAIDHAINTGSPPDDPSDRPRDQPRNTHAIAAGITRDHQTNDLPPPTPSPGELRREKRESPPKSPPSVGTPVPKPNRGTEIIDVVRAAGATITPDQADFRAVKSCPASPNEIAEAYIAAFRGDWDPGGDGWLQGNLSLQVVIKRLAGYAAWKTHRVSRNGRTEAPRRVIVDHTGCPAGCTNTHPERAA